MPSAITQNLSARRVSHVTEAVVSAYIQDITRPAPPQERVVASRRSSPPAIRRTLARSLARERSRGATRGAASRSGSTRGAARSAPSRSAARGRRIALDELAA